MIIIDAPEYFMSERAEEEWHIDARTISGGITLLGKEPIINSFSAVWTAKITLNVVDNYTKSTIGATLDKLRGKSCGLRIRHGAVPYLERSGYETVSIPHSDETFFSDNSGYANSAPSFQSAVLSPVRSNNIVFDPGLYALPALNQCITVNGQMVRITGISRLPYNMASVTFEPPLRKECPIGATVQFEGYVVMRLVQDKAGAYTVNPDGLTQSSIELIELPDEI